MKITGIAQPTQPWYDRTSLPAGDMVFLAMRALRFYQATQVVTGLKPGWDQSLVKAAIELDLPFTVVLPYPGYELAWNRSVRIAASDLLVRARRVEYITGCSENDAAAGAWKEAHYRRVDQADLLMALWDFRFAGETYQVMNYALQTGKEVVNLWQDWDRLARLKRRPANQLQGKCTTGAQVYDNK